MGWNGSGQRGAAPVQPKVTAKKPSPVRGLIAGAVVVTLAVVAYFAFFSGSEKPQAEKSDKGRGRIKEVTPAAAPTNAVAVKKEEQAKPVRKGGPGGGKPSRFVDGHYVSPDPAYPAMKKRLDEQMKKDPFHYFCDNQIYSIVCAEPGDFLIPVPFDARFMQEFKKSLEDPIIVKKDDPEDIKEMKKAVIDAKIWLCDQMAKGEDITKILTEARDKVNKLSQLQEYYRGEILDMKRSGEKTPEEIQDYVDAANKIIDKYAAEKLDFPHPALKAHVKFIRSPREVAAERAKAESQVNVETKGTNE